MKEKMPGASSKRWPGMFLGEQTCSRRQLSRQSPFFIFAPVQKQFGMKPGEFWSRDKGSIGDIEGKTEKSMTGIKPVTDFSV